jgi:hypothetical protein
MSGPRRFRPQRTPEASKPQGAVTPPGTARSPLMPVDLIDEREVLDSDKESSLQDAQERSLWVGRQRG